MYNGAMVAALSEIVPSHVRASGFSLAFSLAAALFGTFTPLASTFLINASGNQASPGFWLMFAAYCSIMATAAFYRTNTSAATAAAPALAAEKAAAMA
jgi:MHS family citrate/tricarballylate:H+ symporter-like MFS transporter